jgi:hypothetical protein
MALSRLTTDIINLLTPGASCKIRGRKTATMKKSVSPLEFAGLPTKGDT